MSTLKDIARIISDRYDLTQQNSEEFVSAMFDVVKEQLTRDDLVKIKGLGTFKVQNVPERASVDVNTGEKIVIDSHDRINFTPDNSMKDSVNKPFSHFETVVLNDGVVFDDIEGDKDSEKQDNPSTPIEIADKETVKTTEEPRVQVTPLATEELNVAVTSETPITPVELATIGTVTDEVTINDTVPAEEPKTEELNTKELTKEENQTEDMKLEDYETSNPSLEESHVGTFLTVLFAILLLVVGFVIGRATSDVTFSDIKEMIYPSKKPEKKTVIVYNTVKSMPAQQAPKAEKTKKEVVKTTATKVTPAKQIAEKKAEAVKPATENKVTAESSKYDSDPRIRYGAYRITGVAQTVTAKEGQTIESVSKTYLGPGMECYVEAVNGGVKELKAGQKVKIPSLQIKKRKK